MQHPAGGEQQQAVVQGLDLHRLMRPGVQLELAPIALAPAGVEVQDGCDAPCVNRLVAVIVQWEAAAVACNTGSSGASNSGQQFGLSEQT